MAQIIIIIIIIIIINFHVFYNDKPKE